MTVLAKRKKPNATEPRQTKRVAIYTRKSVVEGLEQEFNTLDAQRAAVEGHIRGQAGNGWVALETRYDDGGFSGATTDRPAFKQLMKDIDAGEVDVVAVYRLDRLSRSLLDYSQLQAFLDKKGVAFISVTEQFETSTPMGRMVLNLLANFAQFERETIAQRTRDKMGAARRRGMWTGGRPVLGYDVVDKKLVVNPDEAEQVRDIFALYLDLCSLQALAHELDLRGIRNKNWVTKKGREQGGGHLDKSTLQLLLRNPIYTGRTRAGDSVVEGQHEAIIDQATWGAVQAKLASQAPTTGRQRRSTSTALLAGISRCHCGSALTPSHTKRGGRSHTYYVCVQANKQGAAACPKSSIAAGKLEEHVLEQVRLAARDPAILQAAAAADERERAVDRGKLRRELEGVTRQRGRRERERRRLLKGLGDGDESSGVRRRLLELDTLLGESDARIEEVKADQAALEAEVPDLEVLWASLEDFDAVLRELRQEERKRVIALLLERVVLNGPAGDVELHFRARTQGVRA